MLLLARIGIRALVKCTSLCALCRLARVGEDRVRGYTQRMEGLARTLMGSEYRYEVGTVKFTALVLHALSTSECVCEL